MENIYRLTRLTFIITLFFSNENERAEENMFFFASYFPLQLNAPHRIFLLYRSKVFSDEEFLGGKRREREPTSDPNEATQCLCTQELKAAERTLSDQELKTESSHSGIYTDKGRRRNWKTKDMFSTVFVSHFSTSMWQYRFLDSLRILN